MSVSRNTCVAAAVVATAALSAVVPTSAGARGARPDFVISRGAVQLVGRQVSGSFVVRDVGRSAGRSHAVLALRVGARRRTLTRFAVGALRRGSSQKLTVTVQLPSGLPSGTYPVEACADSAHRYPERSERNNCRIVGALVLGAATAPQQIPAPAPVPAPQPSPTPTPTPTPDPAPSSVPSDPVAYTPDTVFVLNSPLTPYWVDVPASYDSSNATPITLFVFLHGCGGEGAGDIYTVSPAGPRSYISITVGGREDACWDVDQDTPKVLAAIADVKTHFNINPRKVVLGGYSSGGDLSYRVAFYNAKLFAGLLIENSSPFRDTGSSQSASLAAAAWKFHVVHLAHLQDTTYPIAGVRAETDAMQGAGFPITRVEVDGGHYDNPGDIENGHPVPGTNADLQTYLLPHLDDDWLAPAS